MSIKIIVDSSCGYSKEEANSKGYLFVPLNVFVNGKNYTEGVDITADEFYSYLGKGPLPKTSQPSPSLYEEAFNEATKDGDDALLLSISSKISGSLQAANIAKQSCEHPDKVHLFDTLTFFGGMMILLEEIKRHPEMNIDELIAHLEELKGRIRVYAGMDTLDYVRKGGRLTGLQFALAAFIHAKPIGTTDDGKITLAGKAIGTKNAMKYIVSKCEEYPIDFSYPCYLLYSSEHDLLNRFRDDFFLKAFPEGTKWPDIQIDPLIGSHIGPKVFGVFYVSKPIEKKESLIQKIVSKVKPSSDK